MLPLRQCSALVAIVARSRETIVALQRYFDKAGLASHAQDMLVSIGVELTTAVVFPDEFDFTEVTSWLAALRELQPKLLLIVVTCQPRTFGPILDLHSSALNLILPKPALGWTIVDAIRDHGQVTA